MSNNEPAIQCSFCKRRIVPNSQYDLPIYDPRSDFAICAHCIKDIYHAIEAHEADQQDQQKVEAAANIDQEMANIKPHLVKDYLDQYIINQDRAKKILSVAIYNHYKRMKYGFDHKDDELDEISMRLDLLHKLSLKYGDTDEEMLEYLADAKAELDNITFSEEKLFELKKLEETLYIQTKSLADELSEVRIGAGERLSSFISDELAFLDMPNVTFKVSRIETDLTENGQDYVEFLISANAGETPKPLAKIASGGELSRIMLAIKNVLADTDSIGTMIFDEIDTGVSGRAAHKIALKLREVSKGRQVLCVTHLAQIAAQGDVHLFISKSVSDGKTYTKIQSLATDERVDEIARIMGGIEITDLQLQSAREMLVNAGNY